VAKKNKGRHGLWAKAGRLDGQAGPAPTMQAGLKSAPLSAGMGYTPPMKDRFFYPLAAVVTVGMVVLALVWPQGQGVPSPAPFGHPQTGSSAKPSAGPDQ
jgi:hypothetical protein